ncbi:hypothetical protein FIU87_10695 [Bacillus sp. THAF10]|nr:hypothetical protein FIU87_10695 [Bacillus sp. THAF10]
MKNYAKGDYYVEVLGKGNKNRICVIKPKVFVRIVEFMRVKGFPICLAILIILTYIQPTQANPIQIHIFLPILKQP